jgi:hypothetical protein
MSLAQRSKAASSSRSLSGRLAARFVVSFRSSLRLKRRVNLPSRLFHSFQSPIRIDPSGRRRQARRLCGGPAFSPVR